MVGQGRAGDGNKGVLFLMLPDSPERQVQETCPASLGWEIVSVALLIGDKRTEDT